MTHSWRALRGSCCFLVRVDTSREMLTRYTVDMNQATDMFEFGGVSLSSAVPPFFAVQELAFKAMRTDQDVID